MSGPFRSTIPIRRREQIPPGDTCRRPTCHRARLRGYRGFCEPHHDAFLNEQVAKNELVRGYTDAAPVAGHIAKLQAAGIGSPQLARLTGITAPTLQRIKKQKLVLVDTARRVLAITPDLAYEVAAPKALVSATGTVRRLRALYAAGFDSRYLARQLDVNEGTVCSVLNGRPTVEARLARGAVELFQRLQMAPGPDTPAGKRCRRRAEKRGWALPLDWDEDMIDDPKARPPGYRVDRDARLRQYEELRASGMNTNQIALRMGIDRASLVRWLERNTNRAA